jgi:hypothetical protein
MLDFVDNDIGGDRCADLLAGDDHPGARLASPSDADHRRLSSSTPIATSCGQKEKIMMSFTRACLAASAVLCFAIDRPVLLQSRDGRAPDDRLVSGDLEFEATAWLTMQS